MIRYTIILLFLGISFNGFAQEITSLSNTYAPNITEKYHALKSDMNIKQGLYQAFYKHKTLVATGMYTQGKRTGTWHFYDHLGRIIQHYNYDRKQFMYAIQEDTTANVIQYEFVPKPGATDSLTLPYKVGGLLYGYLPIIKKFKVKDASLYYTGSVFGVLELLISPNGLLAECKLTVKTRKYIDGQLYGVPADSYLLNIDLLNQEDKEFVPATVNHKNISSTIYLYCNIANNGLISVY